MLFVKLFLEKQCLKNPSDAKYHYKFKFSIANGETALWETIAVKHPPQSNTKPKSETSKGAFLCFLIYFVQFFCYLLIYFGAVLCLLFVYDLLFFACCFLSAPTRHIL